MEKYAYSNLAIKRSVKKKRKETKPNSPSTCMSMYTKQQHTYTNLTTQNIHTDNTERTKLEAGL